MKDIKDMSVGELLNEAFERAHHQKMIMKGRYIESGYQDTEALALGCKYKIIRDKIDDLVTELAEMGEY